MQAEVRFEAGQALTDQQYVGTAFVVIVERNIQQEFGFTMFFPNDRKHFFVAITMDGQSIVEHAGAKTIREQIDSYNNHQLAIFLLLFRGIVDVVKQAQLTYGGITEASPLAGVMEEIRYIGKEPVASFTISKRFTWKPDDCDMFQAMCEVCM